MKSEISYVKFDGIIWSLIPVNGSDDLLIDYRDQERQHVFISLLSTQTLLEKRLGISITWWEKILAADDERIYLLKYDDPNDPTVKSRWSIDQKTGSRDKTGPQDNYAEGIILPYVYEHGTGYHQLVSQFLSMELPLSCEYLEFENKIIISYYLRSEKGFDRFLLLVEDGKLMHKVKQDHQMKGFAPGSFFVWNSQLIFVRDGNEVGICRM